MPSNQLREHLKYSTWNNNNLIKNYDNQPLFDSLNFTVDTKV